MKFNKTLAALATVFSLAPVFGAAAQPHEPLRTNRALLSQEMARVGCKPAPSSVFGQHDNKTYIHNLFVQYCEENAALEEILGDQFTDIALLGTNDPYQTILALRAVPPEQKAQRDRMAQAAAIDLARAALDYAFTAESDKNKDLAQARKDLHGLLDKLTQGNPAERAQIHKQAYGLRMSLEARNFRYHYVQAAQAVTMAASMGEPGTLGEPPGVSTDRAWVSLNRAADAYDATLIYDAARRTGARYITQDVRRENRRIVDNNVRQILQKHLLSPN